MDASQRIIFWNRGAQRTLGFTKGEVLGRRCYEVIAGWHGGRLWCNANCPVHRAVRRGALPRSFDLTTRNREGKGICVNVSILTWPSGGKRLAVHIMRDVTRQAQTTAALRHVLSTLRAYGMIDRRHSSDGKRTLSFASPAVPRDEVSELTRRELEVIALLAEGLTSNEIADRLGISRHTVRSHIENMLHKAGLHNQAQLVSFAYRKRLL